MIKKSVIILTISLVFILSGCTKISTEESAQEESGVIESVADALKNNRVLKCIYVDEEGEEIPTYIKGDKVYLEGDQSDEVSKDLRGIATKDKYYLWSVKTNEGAVIDLAVDDEDAIEMNGNKVKSSVEMIKQLENNSKSCEYAKIDNSVFEIPDIEFKAW